MEMPILSENANTTPIRLPRRAAAAQESGGVRRAKAILREQRSLSSSKSLSFKNEKGMIQITAPTPSTPAKQQRTPSIVDIVPPNTRVETATPQTARMMERMRPASPILWFPATVGGPERAPPDATVGEASVASSLSSYDLTHSPGDDDLLRTFGGSSCPNPAKGFPLRDRIRRAPAPSAAPTPARGSAPKNTPERRRHQTKWHGGCSPENYFEFIDDPPCSDNLSLSWDDLEWVRLSEEAPVRPGAKAPVRACEPGFAARTFLTAISTVSGGSSQDHGSARRGQGQGQQQQQRPRRRVESASQQALAAANRALVACTESWSDSNGKWSTFTTELVRVPIATPSSSSSNAMAAASSNLSSSRVQSRTLMSFPGGAAQPMAASGATLAVPVEARTVLGLEAAEPTTKLARAASSSSSRRLRLSDSYLYSNARINTDTRAWEGELREYVRGI